MNYLSKKAQSITPYVPGEQPRDQKYIKINTNENPYGPSPFVLEQITLKTDPNLYLYPDPNSTSLTEIIANRENVDPCNVFCSNGSDETLAFAFLAFFNREKPILFPDITYSFYPVYCDLYDIPYQEIPLDENLCIQNEMYETDNGGIIFANPNAPTGIVKPLSQIEELLTYNLDKGVVIVDEAYVEFGGQTAVPLIEKYPNLLVIRTLSKSHALAGLRIGYAIGHPDLIDGINRIKNSFNSYPLDRIAQIGACAALRDEDYYFMIKNKIIATRERVSHSLKELGFFVPESRANFVFISHKDISAQDLFAYLKTNGVLVRHFNKPKINQFLRVTIGTDAEMDIFLTKVTDFLKTIR